MNQVIVVGRIANELVKNNNGDIIVTLAITRQFKNEQGIYETDFIPCRVNKSIADNLINYCRIGDLIGIKGRLEESKNNNSVIVFADKVTFLSITKNKEKNEEN